MDVVQWILSRQERTLDNWGKVLERGRAWYVWPRSVTWGAVFGVVLTAATMGPVRDLPHVLRMFVVFSVVFTAQQWSSARTAWFQNCTAYFARTGDVRALQFSAPPLSTLSTPILLIAIGLALATALLTFRASRQTGEIAWLALSFAAFMCSVIWIDTLSRRARQRAFLRSAATPE